MHEAVTRTHRYYPNFWRFNKFTKLVFKPTTDILGVICYEMHLGAPIYTNSDYFRKQHKQAQLYNGDNLFSIT